MKICIITTGQPSTNPRVVKEADALTQDGYEVIVLGAFWSKWALKYDKTILKSRKWVFHYVGGVPDINPLYYFFTRARNRLSTRLLKIFPNNLKIQKWSLSRVLPELESEVQKINSHLYISHYPATLSAAYKAAKKYNSMFGFDAEDFHTDNIYLGKSKSYISSIIEKIEAEYLPRCAYVTAASEVISEAYKKKYGISKPTTIHNVFPLSNRPKKLKTSSNSPLKSYWFSQTIGPDRGLEDIIKAMGALKGYEIELHLRGVIKKNYEQKLINLAIVKAVNPEKIFFYEADSPENMIHLAAGYDVGLALEQNINHNRNICLTNKIFTYLLAGNAIIATNTDGQRRIMDDIGGAGFSYEQGDIDALAKGLKNWYENRSELNKARSESWEWGGKKYNWDMEKRKFLKVINTIFNQ